MTEQPPINYELSTPPAEPSSGGRGLKGLAIAGVIAVVVLALAGGAFAVYQKLDGGGAQPHDVLPASVVAYARVDLDPSASQKVALFKLIRKFPKAADEIGIKSADQDVRKLLVEEALKEGDCDLTYDKDVEPWLGHRIGVAFDTKQTPLVAIQVSDEKKAEAGIKDLFECGDSKAAVAFLDGYAIVAETQKQADAAVKAAEKAPLADKEAFVEDFDKLGEQGVASAWGDFEKMLDVPGLRDGFAASSGGAGNTEELLKQAGTFAATVRVEGSTLELAGQTGVTDLNDMSPVPLGKLPADTVAALSIGGLGEQIADQYEMFLAPFLSGLAGPSATGPDPSITEGMTPEQKAAFEDLMEDQPTGSPGPNDFISEFEESTGLKLPDDLETLFGEGLTFAVGSENLESLPTLSGPQDVGSLDVALKMTTDPDKALDLADRLAALASSQLGVSLSTSQTDDGAVIATNPDAAQALDGSGKLGSDETFTSVMPFGDETLYGLFVDVGTILDKVSEADPPADVREDIDEAKALKAVGVSYGTKDKRSVFSVRIAFAK